MSDRRDENRSFQLMKSSTESAMAAEENLSSELTNLLAENLSSELLGTDDVEAFAEEAERRTIAYSRARGQL